MPYIRVKNPCELGRPGDVICPGHRIASEDFERLLDYARKRPSLFSIHKGNGPGHATREAATAAVEKKINQAEEFYSRAVVTAERAVGAETPQAAGKHRKLAGKLLASGADLIAELDKAGALAADARERLEVMGQDARALLKNTNSTKKGGK